MKKSNRRTEQQVDRTSVIGKETQIDGDFSTDENIRIDGFITGNITCEKKIVLGVTGKINGIVKAAEVFLQGEFSGEIHCSGHIELKATSKVEAKIVAQTIAIEEDAQFNGSFHSLKESSK